MTIRGGTDLRISLRRLRPLLLAGVLAIMLLAPPLSSAATTTHSGEHVADGAGKEPGADADAHRHPSMDETAGKVELREKLGDFIPLDLTFRDEEGREVRLSQLIDAPTIIAPVYYHCPNVCTFLQGGLARALPELKLEPGQEFNVISVSFDETETPALARSSEKTYMAAMENRFPEDAWSFLTGDRDNIHRLLDAAGYSIERRGEDFLHPVVVFVVSPEGKIVRYLHGTSFLPKDLTLALMEASTGTVGTTIRKVVSFCFSYDPENRTYVFNVLRVSATVVMASAGGFLAFLLLTGRRQSNRREKHD